MASEIVELYPRAGVHRALRGTYLSHGLHACGTTDAPFLYANFVTSIDGRIAVTEADTGEAYVLDELTSGNDWRLFQELQAQAHCTVTHGAYLRAVAAGKFPDILQVGVADAAADLGRWRVQHGLPAQPAVVIVSRSLDFPMPESLSRYGQTVYVLTGAAAPAGRVRAWEQQGQKVIRSGTGAAVDGVALMQTLGRLGYASVYLLAGPRLLDTTLRAGALSRLYLTMTHQLVGGEVFDTIAHGPLLGRAGGLRLHSLYYDASSPKGIGQWFSAFDVRAHGRAQTGA